MTATSVETRELNILVGDDQPDVLIALGLLLKGAGHRTVAVDSPLALLRAAVSSHFDLILMDLNYARDTTSGREGLDLLDQLRERRVSAPVVVMTAWGNVELAVQAMQRGASDFVRKPWDNAQLLQIIGKQARRAAARLNAERGASEEMDIARHVQRKLFPAGIKRMQGAIFAGYCAPARAVGGDYYDFFDMGAAAAGFLLADVSGKGMAAALLMAHLQAAFRSQIGVYGHDPKRLLASVNKLFFESTPPEHYASVVFCRYEEVNRKVKYVNCGHVQPVLARRDGDVERLPSTATVLGLFGGWSCEEAEIALESGDTLVLFSDGLTDAGMDHGEGSEFGEARLLAAIETVRLEPVDRLVKNLVDAARTHGAVSGKEAEMDDCTAVAVRAL